ncbi:MAG: glycosyltransferase family 1 protein [Fimbriimonadaceae bacterium]
MIAVDCRMIRHSGIGTYIQRFLPRVIEAMPEQRFILAGNPELLSGLIRKNVEILQYDLPIYSFRHHRGMRRALKGRAKLLWTPHFNAPAGGGLTQVTTIHDVMHLARPEFFGGMFKRFIAWTWYRQTVKNARQIIAISNFTASEIVRFFPDAKAKTTIIKNFVEPGYGQFDPQPIPYGRPYFLTVGNIKPHKNVGLLLRAYGQVKDRLDADIVVVGQSDGFVTGDPGVKASLECAGSRVHFPGFVEQDLLKSLYTKALATVFPSHYEGFGLGHLESMTLGCPVLASDIPTTREVCGNAALTFDPNNPFDLADKLIQAEQDEQLRNRLRTEGLERAKLFPADKPVAQVVELLRSLVN